MNITLDPAIVASIKYAMNLLNSVSKVCFEQHTLTGMDVSALVY